MSFLSALYTLIISPLELLFEVIFTVANRIIGNEGLSIVFLSLAVNFLVLPLYKRADELQAEERDIQAKMAYRIKRTKETFKGDERFLMLQEYYRINNYKPIYALKSSASLLLQIPFFIAAYRLLSGMQSLQGMRFGFITDLGKEDAHFMIGNFPVNVLPILMTVINIVSGIIYTKGHPLKSKIQVYGLAVVFLVLLYHSPAGLVFYWLLNNVFSLVKNIFYKLKDPRKILNVILAAAGVIILIPVLLRQDLDVRQKVLLSCGCVLLCVPLISGFIKPKLKQNTTGKTASKDKFVFVGGAVFMALITGLLIPATIVNASPFEFIDILHPDNPYTYVVNAMLISFGSWVLWGSVFYFFMNDKIKLTFCRGIWVLCGVSVVDYMLFGTDLGNLSALLQYDLTPVFKLTDYLFNLLIISSVAVIFAYVYNKSAVITRSVIAAGVIAVAGIGIYQSSSILNIYKLYEEGISPSVEMPSIPLSKNGQNVIVLMLDRAMGTQVPYIFNEKPELLEKYDGFTYYPNTISYGTQTNFASPALYGGYEYTPERINARTEESLESKHDEALLVMPVIFGKNGYEVTIFDPSYAGYEQIPDLSIYDAYPDFNCYVTYGMFSIFDDDNDSASSVRASERVNEIRNRNFFFFSLMKVSPLVLQETIYDDGGYNESVSVSDISDGTLNMSPIQHMYGLSKSTGLSNTFLQSYPVLTKLPELTNVNDSADNTFFIMANITTHSPNLLQEPDYVPALSVDNTAYDTEDMVSRYTLNGVTMKMENADQVTHYHVNMATFLRLGDWFDYLREQGVYDNTRIILVSDHGRDLGQFGIACDGKDLEHFMPLLMVKDFNATGFTVSDDFMTNGDTPVLATSGLITDPVNPTTGNPITSDAKSGPQTVFYSPIAMISENHGNTFLPGSWYTFTGGDPHDPENWTYLGDY